LGLNDVSVLWLQFEHEKSEKRMVKEVKKKKKREK